MHIYQFLYLIIIDMEKMPLVLAFLHRLDRDADVLRELPPGMTQPQRRERYALITRRLEAWQGAQRDGYTMPRDEALYMLAAARPPADPHEEAVSRRYQLLTAIAEDAGRPISNADLRRYSEMVGLSLSDDVQLSLGQLMNGDVPEHFLHPLLRAITVYDEVNQLELNGQHADAFFRALFYRVMLDHGYTLFRYIVLSAQAPCFKRQPPPASQDEGIQRILDFMRGIDQAKEAARHLVAEDEARFELPRQWSNRAGSLNHRQRMVIAQALANPGLTFTMENHCKEHGVAYATARADLYELRDAGLLVGVKRGKAWVFSFAENEASSIPPAEEVIDHTANPIDQGEIEEQVAPERPERTWYFW